MFQMEMSPLAYACWMGNLDCAKKLYELGADAHGRFGDVSVEITVAFHSDVSFGVGSFQGADDTLFTLACSGGNLEVAQWLADVVKVDIRQPNAVPPDCSAC